MRKYINSSRAYRQLLSDEGAGRLSHTYLFVQSDKEYTKHFTTEVCKLILCKNKGEDQEPCGVCNNCKKVEKNIHSDLIVFGDESKIMVSDTKSFLDTILVRPYESDRKIYVLHGIEDMNETSQNKILKTLEEPPADTYILLTTTNEYKVLQTVKSRSKKIYLDGLTFAELESELTIRNIKNPELIAIESGGNLSAALMLAKSGISSEGVYNLVLDTFSNFKSASDLMVYTSKLNSNKNQLPLILDFFAIFARDLLFYKNNAEDLLLNKHKLYDIANIAEDFTTDALLKIVQATTEAKKKLTYNVTVLNIVDIFLLRFLEVRIKCKKELA